MPLVTRSIPDHPQLYITIVRDPRSADNGIAKPQAARTYAVGGAAGVSPVGGAAGVSVAAGAGGGAGGVSTRGAGAGAGARFFSGFVSPAFSNSMNAVLPPSPRRRS